MKKEKEVNFSGKENWFRRSSKFFPNILINFLAIGALALMTVVAFDFDIQYILSATFYITSGVLIILYTITHWSWYDSKLKAIRSSPESKAIIKEKEQKIEETTTLIEWQRYRHKFITERNENELIKSWRIYVQNKLTRLLNKARTKDLNIESAHVTDLQLKTLGELRAKELKEKYDLAREKNSFCTKKRFYEERLKDEWILENKNKIMVDYNQIDTQFIETGSVIKGIFKDKTQSRGKYAKDNAPNRLASFLLTFFITAFATDVILSGGTPDAWATFSFRMLLLVMNMVMGMNYAQTFYEDVDMHNIDARVSIAKEFKSWGLDKGILKIKGEEKEKE
jgi:hypothetical protein